MYAARFSSGRRAVIVQCVAINARVSRELRVAYGDIAGKRPVLDVEFGDEQPIPHADDLIEEGAPFALAIGADAGRRVEREHLDMRLDAERVDRNAAFAETFEQAQHVGAMFRMLRLPAHIVVIDELGMRRGIARSEKPTSETQSLMRS